MPLTDTAVRQAKPASKPVRLFDERGLYLEVSPPGGKLWRLKYRHEGKEKRLALGQYPDVSLAKARTRRDEARRLLADGIDPGAQRKAAKTATAESFEAIAREWHMQNRGKWSAITEARVIERLEKDVFPFIGARGRGEINAPELLACLRRTETRGAIETVHRLRQYCEIFAYAVATGRAGSNPGAAIRGVLKSKAPARHHAAITDPRKVGDLLRTLEGYQGNPLTRAALMLAPLVFVRPGELRAAEWREIDLETARWEIPAEKMKMRQSHIVPLSSQAVAILREAHMLTGRGRYVFPSLRSADRCMSENTVTAALRRLGYSGAEMTGHGFRTVATTLLNEQGWNRDAIERQMAHGERNKVRAAYNRAEHLPERIRMMQAWADYLDGLKACADVLPFKRNV